MGRAALDAAEGGQRNAGSVREFPLFPAQKRPCSADLPNGDHAVEGMAATANAQGRGNDLPLMAFYKSL